MPDDTQMPRSCQQCLQDVNLLWADGRWRCELHTGDNQEIGRLLVYRGDIVLAAESVSTGEAAYARAEILRQVIR